MIRSVLQAFATVFPAELPDKTMIATIILVTRFRRPLWVWLGAATAFLVHVIVAVAAGSALGLLPDPVVSGIVTVLFLGGAILLLREARRGEDEDLEATAEPDVTARSTFIGSFGLVVLAEWGDLTQLATASLAAASRSPLATGVGAWAALISVAAIAVVFGRKLVERVPLHRINYVGAAVFGLLGVWSALEFLDAIR